MALCDNIRNSRKQNQMTQKQLAEKIGVSHNTISDWESGEHKPDIDTVMQLCQLLNVEPNYMLDFDSKMKEFEQLNNNNLKYQKILMDKGLMDKDGNIDEKNFEKIINIGIATKQILDKEKD